MILTKFLSICLILVASIGVCAKEWRGIIPFRSSREDVQRLLSAPKRQGKYVDSYELDDAFVDIYYASGPDCGGSRINSWRVARNTVVSIRITHKKAVPLESLVGDASGLKHLEDISGWSYYSNDEEGVRYTVRRDNSSSLLDVTNVDYLPSSADYRLKCSIAAPTNHEPSPFEYYGDVTAARRGAILDNIAIQLELNRELKAVIVPNGPARRMRAALKAGRYARNYLVHVRKVPSNRIILKSGKGRDEFMIELYLLPPNTPVP
jgi:hypothetical protein